MEIFRLPRCEGLISPKGGDLQAVTRWRSSDRHMVEVSRTQQDEGLEVATKRRFPGRHREEIFMSPKDGNLQVATRWRSPVSFIQPETQAIDSVFCKHSKPWFSSWKKDVGNRDLDC